MNSSRTFMSIQSSSRSSSPPQIARAFAALALLLLLVSVSRPAHAQDKRAEAAARDALKKSQGDFRQSAFEDAIIRLQRALKTCAPAKCSAATRAQLQRDVGVMQFRRGKRDTAVISFTEALALDPNVELTGAYAAPDVRGVWDPLKEEAAAVASQPAGDFVHTPVSEQASNTPVPVYVEYEGSSALKSVSVKYRPRGATDWKRIELARRGKGWGGLIPCADVAAGLMQYYVQGFDEGGSPSALSGSVKRPYLVPIRVAISSPPPSLPGAAPPSKCADTSDCPPGMAGCAEAAGGSSEGQACEDDSQCSVGKCEKGHCASEKTESSTPGAYARVWLGVSASIDLARLRQDADVCKLTTSGIPYNASGYYCTNPDSTDFPSRQSSAENDTLTRGNSGAVPAGFTAGNIRVMVSFDYALSANFLLGARLGYVLGTYPGDAAVRDKHGFNTPIHAEARGTYLFGDAPLAKSGFAPFAFVGAGVAAFTAKTSTVVQQTGIPGTKQVDAWLTGGPGFVALGVGVRYAFSRRVAFSLALKGSAAFGSARLFPTLAPEVALQYGF
jgi:hypothetical protein